MYKRNIAATLAIFLLFSAISAQNPAKAEVTIGLNEAFFDSFLDSMFQNFDPPQFSFAQNLFNQRDTETPSIETNGWGSQSFSFVNYTAAPRLSGDKSGCTETVKLLRELNGVKTAVRFREGKIYAPIAFSGGYAPPFIGCIEFSGWAETNLDLEFDQSGQRLIGRIRVLNVNLSGTGGVGGTVIAKLIQGSIDKKLNPIEIMRLDKVSFGVPIQNVGNMTMKALGMRPEIANGILNITVSYQFVKS